MTAPADRRHRRDRGRRLAQRRRRRVSVRALDLATGATRWEVATMEKLAAPVAHAGLVVLSEGDNHLPRPDPGSRRRDRRPALGDAGPQVLRVGDRAGGRRRRLRDRRPLRHGHRRRRPRRRGPVAARRRLGVDRHPSPPQPGTSVAFHDFARRPGRARPLDGRRPLRDPAGRQPSSTPPDRRPSSSPPSVGSPPAASRRTCFEAGALSSASPPGPGGPIRPRGRRGSPLQCDADPTRRTGPRPAGPGSRTPASSKVVPRTRGAGGRRTQPEERKPHPWLKPSSP